MGGCYEDRYHTSSAPVRTDTVPSLVYEFFRTKDKTNLLEAYKQFLLGSQSKRFIRYLLERKEIQAGINEFPGIEIESKLEVRLKTQNKKATQPTLAEVMDLIEFPPAQGARFLKDACNNEALGQNHFYGTDEEERFVLIEKGKKWYLKEKGVVEPYNYGLPGENFVLRRPETRVETNPLMVAQTIVEKYSDGKTKYFGYLDKNKIEAFLVNSNSGRLYSLVVSDALKEKKTQQMQLEVEYAGYIPGFKDFNEKDERSIVEDILYIDKVVVGLHNNSQINGYRVNFIPTTESKFQFISGKERAKEENLVLFPGIRDLRLGGKLDE